jgi:hypothetical protein
MCACVSENTINKKKSIEQRTARIQSLTGI